MKTFGDVINAGFKMRGKCPRCGRDEILDFTRYDRNRIWVGKTFRCRCGGVAAVKVVDPAVEAYRKQMGGW
jgi:predicted RNA-binding Zn-ribbon protein involved in translation (DUF1610 family)